MLTLYGNDGVASNSTSNAVGHDTRFKRISTLNDARVCVQRHLVTRYRARTQMAAISHPMVPAGGPQYRRVVLIVLQVHADADIHEVLHEIRVAFQRGDVKSRQVARPLAFDLHQYGPSRQKHSLFQEND